MGMMIELIDRLSLLNKLNDKFQSIADINEVVIEQPTVEAIPKADYEKRLKADIVAMLTELQMDIEECVDGGEGSLLFEQGVDIARCQVVDMIQQKINALKENTDGKRIC